MHSLTITGCSLLKLNLCYLFKWFQVSSGMNCIFSQELVAMNAAEKHCSSIGEISKLATVTPDVDAALDCLSDLDL